MPSVEARYRNPVYDGYFADPFVLAHDGGYVAYGTGSVVDGKVFEVLVSPDLAHWTSVGCALELLPAELGTDYWAPEVVAAEGRYWLYYSVGFGDVGHHLRVASAAAPTGPFVDQGVNLTPNELFAIDPHPFRDVDGTLYLYYARDVLSGDRAGTQLAVDVLTSMTETAGRPEQVLAPTADWQIYQRERHMYGRTYDWHTLEGPNVRLHDGVYYCLYSGGSWQSEGYAVSWARADSPLGPWSEPSGTAGRLLATVPGHVRGPGHNSVVTTAGGTDIIIYHAWDPTGQRRQMCIDPLRWTAGGPRIEGPSWQEKPLPA
jgi:beta-xylosidase